MSGKAPHLVHGMGTALEAPTWPAITVAEAEELLGRFPAAGRLTALRWHSPRPFSAATLAETGEGEFFLKRHHRLLRTPAALAEEHAFMAHLRAAGLTVPEVVEASDGTGSIAEGEWTYELHRKGPGIDLYRDRPSWTPLLTRGHAFEAGAALARLHLAAQGFAGSPREAHPLVSSFTILPAHDPLAAAQGYVVARPALAAFLADKPWQEQLARLFASLGAGLSERLVDQKPLWTHNDWHPSNLLWSPDGAVSTVFDFGLSTRTCALHDLATAIERTAIPWLEPDDEAADAEAAVALLAGYRTVLSLTSEQVQTVLRLLPLVHVEFALSEADYFAGILGDPDQAMLAWQGYLIDHADWFLSPAGQHFLMQIETGAAA
ncbi:phosphotransferase enzyme family protein [Novosphingobium sp. AP12]|uniref:phosphotransferase enzyme family protein n=1 Tax=Novosphingobium sp. AP12 TaxID=1144305 RepID=UPI0002721F0C|nr:aminoglycoside phosphotransferase family protein [Novosphingobium sp. AP12]EJL27782.1 putative homoserine kinase type II (protein kinase fold) [Novosphingobium sp. AP12]